jgi:hypothetical protein
MGILVPEATLPSGIKISNVYMSFSGEVVFVSQVMGTTGPPKTIQEKYNKNHQWQISSHYKVYPKKPQLGSDSNIRVPFATVVPIISQSPYDYLYTALMKQYPSSIEDIETWQIPVPPTSNLVVANSTLVSLYKVINSDSKMYITEPGTSNLILTVDAFHQVTNVISQFSFQEDDKPVTSNLVVANSTLVSLYKDINLDSKMYITEPGTSNLILTVDAFHQVTNVISQFSFQEEEILDEDVPVSRAAALIEESLNASVQE